MWHNGPIPDELAGYPGYLMARLGQASSARFRMALEPSGLHPKHFGVMNIVAARPGITQQLLHEYAAIDTSSMVACVDELEERGLAERRPHPSDRRARAIYLTPAGQETLVEIRKLAAKLQRDFFSALSAEERRTLHELLRKLAEGRAEAPAAD